MSHFYATARGNRGETSRGGSKSSGMKTYCASWSGAVKCYAYVNDEGKDCVRVELISWRNAGGYKLLYDGEFKENYEAEDEPKN